MVGGVEMVEAVVKAVVGMDGVGRCRKVVGIVCGCGFGCGCRRGNWWLVWLMVVVMVVVVGQRQILR